MKLYYPITVDLYKPYPLPIVNACQENIGRGVLVTLTASGAVIVPESESLYVYAKKPDGKIVYASCELEGTRIKVDFPQQMLLISGTVQVEIQMIDANGNNITTPILQLQNQKSNIDYSKIVSTDEFSALVNLMAEVEELKENGLKGEAATIQVGTVTTSEPGSEPQITNSGTSGDAVFNFVLPRGEVGPVGPQGPAGAEVIDSLEEIELVTEPGYAAGALAVKELSSNLDELIAKTKTGTHTPALISGGDSLLLTGGEMTYYVEGSLCFVSCAIWAEISNPNSDPVILTLPFAPTSKRNYGWVGYHNSVYDIVYVICSEGAAEISLETPVKKGSQPIKGTEMVNLTIQFSIVFAI